MHALTIPEAGGSRGSEMKKISLSLIAWSLMVLMGCQGSDTGTTRNTLDTHPMTGEAEILESWQGDYPVAHLNALPEGQREHGLGYIADAQTFTNVWKVLKPEEAVPEVDFKSNLVLFARNTRFFNRIRIGKVEVKEGVAEVLVMETMSAMPIEDKVAVSLAVVPRKGIESIQISDGTFPVTRQTPSASLPRVDKTSEFSVRGFRLGSG
jgi:hypothetical protein